MKLSPSDVAAIVEGYTWNVIASGGFEKCDLLIKPDTDLDGVFRAWDMTCQKWVHVHGYNVTFEEPLA